ncbi:hypothetical protein D3C76_762700 [compost metagenome]
MALKYFARVYEERNLNVGNQFFSILSYLGANNIYEFSGVKQCQVKKRILTFEFKKSRCDLSERAEI